MTLHLSTASKEVETNNVPISYIHRRKYKSIYFKFAIYLPTTCHLKNNQQHNKYTHRNNSKNSIRSIKMFFRLKKKLLHSQIQSKSSKESNVSALKQRVYNRNPEHIVEKQDQNSRYNPCINCNTTIASIYDITSPSGVSQIARIKGFARWSLSKVDIFFLFFFLPARTGQTTVSVCRCA